MTKAKPLFATLLLLLIAAPVAQAADGPLNLTDHLDDRLHEAVERAQAADAPAQKRLILSEAFRSMTRDLDRIKKIPALSSEDEAAVEALQRDIQEQHDRLNGLSGFAPVPDTNLDRFADSVQQDLDLQNRSITISLVGALLIVIIILLIA